MYLPAQLMHIMTPIYSLIYNPDAMSELSHNVFKHLFKRRLRCTSNPISRHSAHVDVPLIWLDLDVVIII